jgi:uncharacterized protein
MAKPIKPAFNEETARAKVKAAQDAWNTPQRRDCSPNLIRRILNAVIVPNSFISRQAIIEFFKRKWAKELDYRLMKELRCYTVNVFLYVLNMNG